MKTAPNWSCEMLGQLCEIEYCTIEYQLVNRIYKFTWSHAYIFIKIVVHASSGSKSRHF